jgi:putative restriction endonuclease
MPYRFILERALWDQWTKKMTGAGRDTGPSHNTQSDEQEKEWENSSPTEQLQPVTVCLAQSFFRKVVLSAYSGRCCLTDIPIPQLLVASHTLPWSTHPEHRADPRNGLCLSCPHDAAFNRKLPAFDEKNRLELSKTIREYLMLTGRKENFAVHEVKVIAVPERFFPNPGHMAIHREEIFSARGNRLVPHARCV